MIKCLKEVSHEKVDRISTGSIELDLLLGQGLFNGSEDSMGLPLSSISIWAGSAGSGKSKLAIKVCSGINAKKNKILYYQLESSFQAFSQWTKDSIKYPDLFMLSDENDTYKQVKEIAEQKPKLVVIDSVNMLLDAHNTIAVKDMLKVYRDIANKLNIHIYLIGKVGKDKKIKGAIDWLYLPDTVVFLNKVDGLLKLTVDKNRFGASDILLNMKHTNTGLDIISEV